MVGDQQGLWPPRPVASAGPSEELWGNAPKGLQHLAQVFLRAGATHRMGRETGCPRLGLLPFSCLMVALTAPQQKKGRQTPKCPALWSPEK